MAGWGIGEGEGEENDEGQEQRHHRCQHRFFFPSRPGSGRRARRRARLAAAHDALARPPLLRRVDVRPMRPPCAAAERRHLCDGSAKFVPGIVLGGWFYPPPGGLPAPLAATPASVAAPPVTGARVVAECISHVAPSGVDPGVLRPGSRATRLLPLALLALPAAPPFPRFAAPLIPAPLSICWVLPWRLWPPLLRGLSRMLPRRFLRLLLLQPWPSLLRGL